MNPDRSDIPGVIARRSARLSIIIPITIRGVDTSGKIFKENTWTINVNKHGGRLATFHQLAPADLIVIENPLLGRAAKGRVIRVCEKHFREDPYEICVELLEAQDVWGVKLPPENWPIERQVVSGEQKNPTPQVAPETQKTPAATVENGGNSETPDLAPPASPVEMGEQAGGLSQYHMVVNALSRFAGEAAAPPSQPASLEKEVGDRLSPLAQESLSRAIPEFQAQRDHAAEQAKAELDDLVKEECGTAAKAISVYVDSAVDSLNRAGEEAVTKLQAAREALELSLKKAAEEFLTQLAEESASMLEKFHAQAQALAARLQSEMESTTRDCSDKT